MHFAEYESLVGDLITALAQPTRLGDHKPSSGSKNRLVGASGYKHQIDLSLSHRDSLFLVEVKHWKRSVGVSAVLVLASRLVDIQNLNPETEVFASVVSTKQATRGAKQLAKHLKIRIDTVKSVQEYAIQLDEMIFVGVREAVYANDNSSASLGRNCNKCGKHFQVRGDEYVCGVCSAGA